MQNHVIYPGTFDPITLGHINLVERASQLFSGVIVAIAANQYKKPLFSLAERVALAQTALSHIKHVTVVGFETLLTDFMHTQGVKVILRGLRVGTDFDYEFQMAGMNRQLAGDIESVFLMPDEQFTYVASSFVREIAQLGGDVSHFVPPAVVEALQRKCQKA